MTLVFASLTPHGWLLLPFIGGPASQKALSSQSAMQAIGQLSAEMHPETLVVMTPHGLKADGCITLLDTPDVRGTTGGSSHLAGTPHSFTLQFLVDRDFNASLVEEAKLKDLPVRRVKNDLPWESLPLDFASAIPLWFLGAATFPQPRVIIVCADPGVDWSLLPAFGAAIREAGERLGRRFAFIASADMGHAHDQNHEYGNDPASKEYEQVVLKAIQSQNLASLIDLDKGWIKRAKTDSYLQLLALQGLLEGSNFKGKVLSYEVPTYFGMMCALWK